jgi:hypothetical protein
MFTILFAALLPWVIPAAVVIFGLHLTPSIEAWLKAHATTLWHDILNSAIYNGIEHAIANVSKLTDGSQSEDEVIATVVNYVKTTVPAALKFLEVKEAALYAAVKARFAAQVKNPAVVATTIKPTLASF